jgi:UDP-N-acetylmuramoyl-tripeptide--D-alanyl-D-alanine ligase
MSGHLTTAEIERFARERDYDVLPGPDQPILGGSADSRLAEPGDIFGAFPGERLDGNDYTADALERGAVAAVCQRLPDRLVPGRTVVRAPSTVTALHELARFWRDTCGPTVIGITGSVGKTTAKDLVAATLATHFATHRSPGNLNSREGLPLALMSLRRDHDLSILELAMDSPGEIAELAAIARPSVGIVLNVGLTHVSKLGSIEAIRDEKLSLARGLGAGDTAILNADDPNVAPAATGLACRTITFGTSPAAGLHAIDVQATGLGGAQFTVVYGDEAVAARSPIPGLHVLPAALAAISACLALGLSLREAVDALEAADATGRMRIHTTTDGITIIDDRYNASPASMAGALGMLRGLAPRRIALLGVMAELGPFAGTEHRKAGAIAAASCDALIATGDACRAMVEAARAAGLESAWWVPTREEAAAHARSLARPGDTILVKASRSQAFEAILPLLEAPR